MLVFSLLNSGDRSDLFSLNLVPSVILTFPSFLQIFSYFSQLFSPSNYFVSETGLGFLIHKLTVKRGGGKTLQQQLQGKRVPSWQTSFSWKRLEKCWEKSLIVVNSA